MDYQLYLLCNCCIYLYILLFLLQILTTPCLLLSLFTSLNLCSGKFGTPITDDVSKLTLLKQNIPSDYEIPVSYIPKEVADTCWVVLNIYPLEQSLRKLANMFGTISSNKENIIVFIAMLKSLRFTFDHEELVSGAVSSSANSYDLRATCGLLLQETSMQTAANFSCKPPPCLNSQQTPGGLEDTRTSNWTKRMPLLLVLIPFTAAVVLIVWLVSVIDQHCDSKSA
uniref:Kit ligand n=1 Tax=Cynoglossus semilaevis TaxID=244447 RepID=A0A3P8VMA6_CYNSE